mmetsp:Transcript_23794/g.36130  ORF Transcript_23794/g.36130 Transcript_23794/m.36130 type:complete len:105 (-) Transcript_23794:1724-2038(-)
MMRTGAKVHMIWIASKRMIDNCIDGCSKADYNTGMATPTNHPLQYVPIHVTALERNHGLLDFVREIAGDQLIRPLSPVDCGTLQQLGYVAPISGLQLREQQPLL